LDFAAFRRLLEVRTTNLARDIPHVSSTVSDPATSNSVLAQSSEKLIKEEKLKPQITGLTTVGQFSNTVLPSTNDTATPIRPSFSPVVAPMD
jgi:hypothetical protein